MNKICPICRKEYDPPIDFTESVQCSCGLKADTEILIEFNKALNLLIEWRKAFAERVFMKPEKEYLKWFVNVTKNTNEFIG